jgi:hypothetical protein
MPINDVHLIFAAQAKTDGVVVGVVVNDSQAACLIA